MSLWRVTLTQKAISNIGGILAWTARHFGPAQRDLYRRAIEQALVLLQQGPGVPGSRPAHGDRPEFRVLALRGRSRHVVMFRERAPGEVVVLRVLHDAMDPQRHQADP
ncbi:type II toxin-antitoxin system RelE/ParE family toxin [Humitalea sp. 24SJ18S-53]|uniref:type II toxin-antitoxin system RelE/ParE family toxin n=1 Tax=Humitalea sp. 24SJ18S-53 TaxID=3422307 RepID=UPI003D67AAAD